MKRFYEGSAAYWEDDDGHYSISDEGGWLPGCFENKEAASMAHKIKHLEGYGILGRLQHAANVDNGGKDGVITVETLTPILKSLQSEQQNGEKL